VLRRILVGRNCNVYRGRVLTGDVDLSKKCGSVMKYMWICQWMWICQGRNVGSVKEVGCHGFSEKSNMLQRRIIPMSKIVLSPSSYVEEYY
jgi:hypothetical protein